MGGNALGNHDWTAGDERWQYECRKCGLLMLHVWGRRGMKGDSKRYFIRWDETEKTVRPAEPRLNPPCQPRAPLADYGASPLMVALAELQKDSPTRDEFSQNPAFL